MPTVKLTKKLIELYAVPTRPIELYDSERRGLICKITPTGNRIFLVGYRSADGTKRKPRIGVFGQITLDQAREAAGKLLAKVSLGEDPSRDRRSSRAGLTVTALCDRFLTAYAEQHSKPSYLKQQKRMLETRIKPVLGTTKVSAVIRHDVMDIHHKLRATPYEANRVLALLSVVFKQAELWGMRTEGSNPCRLVKKYKEKRRERLLSDAEVAAIFKALKIAERDEVELSGALLAIRLLFATACRASEITGLRWAFVDQARAEIVWPDSKTGSFKKPLTEEIRTLLEAAPKSDGAAHVCIGSRADGCLTHSMLAKTWERILGQAGVSSCGLHAIRHRVATDIANSGASIQDGMRLTGHKAVQTYARYLHAEDDRVREAAESVSIRRQSITKDST
jgi:integrase